MTQPDPSRSAPAGLQARSTGARFALWALLGLLACAALLLLAVSWIAGTLATPAVLLAQLDAETLQAALGNTGEMMTAVLAIAITVVAIVVELAATRYSHRVTALFLKDRINLMLLGLYTVTTLICLWLLLVPEGSGAAGAPLPVLAAFALISISLASLLPYFAYVLGFISPLNIIQRLYDGAERALRQASAQRGGRAILAATVEDLHDVAHKAVEQSDRGVAMASIRALFELLERYQEQRPSLAADWYAFDAAFADDPDFVSMEEDALAPVREHGLWFELKVFRQAIAALTSAVPAMRDLASLVAIETRRFGSRHGGTEPELLTLCRQAFNSYLRICINAGDPRSTYYILNQYRALGTALLDTPAASQVPLIAEHFRYYGQLAVQRGQPFLLEVTAYDLVHLIAAARSHRSTRAEAVTDALLDVLLELDLEIRNATEEPSLLGVRRAQLQLGAFLLSRTAAGEQPEPAVGESAPAGGGAEDQSTEGQSTGDHSACDHGSRDRINQNRVDRIAADLAAEPVERLESLCRALEREERPRYWELTERGINFAYLEPEHRAQLPELLRRVASYAGRGDTLSNPA